MTKKHIEELLFYENNPELYYEIYEDFSNNGKELQESYMDGKIEKMVLTNHFLEAQNRAKEYIKLENLDRGLKTYMSSVGVEIKDDLIALKSLVERRLREYELTNCLSNILKPQAGIVKKHMGIRATFLNKMLYDRTDIKTIKAVLYEVARIYREDISLTEEAKTLMSEAGSMIGRFFGEDWLSDGYELPRLNEDCRCFLEHFIENEYGEIRCKVYELWDQKVSVNKDYVAGPLEIIDFFELAVKAFDPSGEENIKVLLDENLDSLSWHNGKKAIIIGGKRSPIKSKKTMFQKIIHELLVHGQRAVRGRKIHPLLGVGIFLGNSYLDFEEGLATILEKIAGGQKMTWEMANMSLYLNVALAARFASFEEIYEINWRLRYLEKILKNSKKTMQDCKKAAYNSTVRIFRGMPMEVENDWSEPLYFAKDSAYLSGRVKVIRYLNEMFEKEDLDMEEILSGKYDPTTLTHQQIYESLMQSEE